MCRIRIKGSSLMIRTQGVLSGNGVVGEVVFFSDLLSNSSTSFHFGKYQIRFEFLPL